MDGFIEDTLFVEGSTHKIDVSFLDENGAAVTPDDATWSLCKADATGTIVNSRTQVTLTPAETMTITLSGDDLVVGDTEGDRATRVLLVEGTYTSGEVTDLPVRRQMIFQLARTIR